jgi:hypothetical protein
MKQTPAPWIKAQSGHVVAANGVVVAAPHFYGSADNNRHVDLIVAAPAMSAALLQIARVASAASHSSDPVAMAEQIEQIAREALP